MIFAFLCLRVIHYLYYLALSLSDLWKCFDQRKPQHLTAERTQIPSHLALLLVANEDNEAETTEKNFVECILRAVTWCQAVGINQLTVYDNQGISFECSQTIRTRLIAGQPTCEDDTGSEVEYPLTPPLSDTSESRPLSPDYDGQLGVATIRVADLPASKLCRPRRQRNVLKRRRPLDNKTPTIPLTLHLASRESSKPAIASVARSYVRTQSQISCKTKTDQKFQLSTKELDSILEGRHGLPSPDFMIIHHLSQPNNHAPLELHGFPPWQIQLTELYLDRLSNSKWRWSHTYSSTSLLEEQAFRAALDEFANAEMRLGK